MSNTNLTADPYAFAEPTLSPLCELPASDSDHHRQTAARETLQRTSAAMKALLDLEGVEDNYGLYLLLTGVLNAITHAGNLLHPEPVEPAE